MISDDERREVAARLRELEVHCWYDGMDEINSLETAIGCSIGQDWQDQDWWHRLADLIDRPTAKREHNGAYWRCAHCGAFTSKDAVIIDGLDVVPLRHCGNCGREWDYD